MIKYKTYLQFKNSGLINCGYIEFAIVIPAKLFIENVIWEMFKIDFHF